MNLAAFTKEVFVYSTSSARSNRGQDTWVNFSEFEWMRHAWAQRQDEFMTVFAAKARKTWKCLAYTRPLARWLGQQYYHF
jgi:hypothetical protein